MGGMRGVGDLDFEVDILEEFFGGAGARIT